MNIAFDAKRYFNNHTGLGNYSRDLLRIMAEHVPANSYYLFASKPNTQYPVPAGVQVFSPGKAPLLWRSYGIVKDLERQGMNVYHGLSNEIPFGIQRSNVKSVVTIHDVIFKRYPQYYRLSDRLIYDYKTAYACRHADKIIATSSQTKDDLTRFYKADAGRIEVVYQVCNPLFRERGLPAPAFSFRPGFLYVSSFQSRKNHQVLLKAYARICKQTELDLTLAGRKGETYEACIQLAEQLGIAQRVHFITDLPTGQLPALYRAASVFVYPSLFEGFGIPLLEAMQCDLPVVCSNIDVFKELAGKAAIYTDPQDELAMGKALLQSLDSGEALKALYPGILRQFDDRLIALQLQMLYQSL